MENTLAAGERLCVDGEVLLREQSLTAEIARELKNYPEGLQLFRELLQNGDDARANQVSFFLHDPATASRKVSDDNAGEETKSTAASPLASRIGEKEPAYLNQALGADCEKPCLLVYNNEFFHPKDFDAIRNIGKSSKKDDATSTGKFGLGFQSVYHITERPSFCSGDALVIMDPHQQDLKGREDNETPFARKWKTSEVPNGHLRDFGPFFDKYYDEEKKFFKGTVFRFVLRDEAAARKSKLKNTPFSVDEMLTLLKE